MENYFKKHQRTLLLFLNTKGGRFLAGEEGHIVHITPNAIHVEKGEQIQARIYADNHFAFLIPILDKILILDSYKPIETPYKAFLHYSGLENYHFPTIYLTQYQQTTTTGGGRDFTNTNASWSTVRGQSSSDNTDGGFSVQSDFDGANYRNFRTFAPFDTSTLAGSKITAGTLDFHRNDVFAPFSNVDSTTLEIVVTTQVSSTVLALSDYSRVTFISKGSLAFSGTSNGTYSSITITDLTSISNGGTTFYGVITGRDLNNSTPSGKNDIGSTTAPRLTVTYTPQGGNFIFNLL